MCSNGIGEYHQRTRKGLDRKKEEKKEKERWTLCVSVHLRQKSTVDRAFQGMTSLECGEKG
jgi:hypothetical protein